MFTLFRRFSTLKDPQFIEKALSRCRYPGNVLELFDSQLNDFDMDKYGL